jgi:cellulose synthase operon protein C
MKRFPFLVLAVLALAPVACQSINDGDTIAKLRHARIEVQEERLVGGLDKAMAGYQRFLSETPESALTPEAIRRLADLKLEKEYGTLTDRTEPPGPANTSVALSRPQGAGEKTPLPVPDRVQAASPISEQSTKAPALDPKRESRADFEDRASQILPEPHPAGHALPAAESGDELERANAREAIALYTKLLDDYPLYDRNDQVLYQMSRAHEELGETESAMTVVDRLIREYPGSRYFDEVQFRRAEYFFARRRHMDAEEAYASVVNIGKGSFYYELALYKLGWTFYKQELYEDALHRFIALLDHKVSVGYDFAQTGDEQERKRMDDTFRVISLSFSNLGGADSVAEYFSAHGRRSYEDSVYSNLGEFYMDKRRYADASAAYDAFVSRNPFHKVSPNFHMRIIEIHAAGGFPSLVLNSKKTFASTYGLQADYWKHFEPAARPDVLSHLKTNLNDLATHYHACYQDPQQVEAKQAHFDEALQWYREYLASFAVETESPAINYQMADLLLENRSFESAAGEYEKTAYGYPLHEKAAQAGYAAVYARREHLSTAAEEVRERVQMDVIRSSLQFSDTFPEHEKAAVVLGAAADDLYAMRAYEQALAAAGKLLSDFSGAEADVRRAAWLVTAHASFELVHYSEAEAAYLQVLELLPAGDQTREELVDNLAAAIYKQGEQANVAEDFGAAADHFLRVGRMAPSSGVRPAAEYDAAAALIQLKEWDAAATVLAGFRDIFPGHALQSEVTKKMAFVYKENGQLSRAADEFERIETESHDEAVRRDALLVAADLHAEAGNKARALEVYRRYADYFPHPVELNIETRNKAAEILKAQNDRESYRDELGKIVAIEAAAGREQTPRTRYLAAGAALVLTEPKFAAFAAVKLAKPFAANLHKKRDLMKAATQSFTKLVDYEVGEVTAAATFYLAEIYAHFSKALMESERPEGLNPMEMEEYELAIEEQAYPFEEQAIAVHENNLKLIPKGVYNTWIDKSLQKLAEFVPAKYDKPEESSGIVVSLDTYTFEIVRPAPPESRADEVEENQAAETAPVGEPDSAAVDMVVGGSGDEGVLIDAEVQ